MSNNYKSIIMIDENISPIIPYKNLKKKLFLTIKMFTDFILNKF